MPNRRRVPTDIRLFLGILALILPLRIVQTAKMKWPGIDGAYYVEVARHVRDGLGLTSHVSLYHSGYDHFPFPTSVYPLWPWMLGMAARVVDMSVAAYWLPLVLYVTALIAAFLFGRKLAPEPLFPTALPGFHAGHVTVLLLGLQREFLVFTSLPYTEGIAWTLLLLYAWRVVTKRDSTAIGWAVESGVWLGLLYLARFNFLVVPMAAAGAYALRFVVGPNRGRVALHGLVALGVASLFIGGWFLHIRGFVHDAGLGSLLRFDQNRASDLLEPMDVIVATHGTFDLLADRLEGVFLAWAPLRKDSYRPSYYTMHWALPVALPLMAIALFRLVRREGVAGVWERLRRPEAVPWFLLVLLAVGALLSIQLAHKQYNGAWYFAKRQGLMSLPAFILPLLWLLRQRRSLPTVLGVLILSSSTMSGMHELMGRADETKGELRGKDMYPALTRWLKKKEAEGPFVVAVDGIAVQRVAWRTENVGYHWLYNKTSYDDLLEMTDRLGVRYVVARTEALKGWRITKEGGKRLELDFERLPETPDGMTILARRPGPRAVVGAAGAPGAGNVTAGVAPEVDDSLEAEADDAPEGDDASEAGASP